MKKETKIMITKDGPILVLGGLPIDKQIIGIGKEGEPEKWIKVKKYLKINARCVVAGD